MDPVTVACEACGQSAFVLKARYKYEADDPNGRPAKDHVLREVQREIECPGCGIRTQTETETEE
jgi:hypothetical protein